MAPTHRILAGSFTLGLLFAALTGCASDAAREAPMSTTGASSTGGPSGAPGEAGAARVCAATASFEGAVIEFRAGLSPEVTIEQLHSARDGIVETYKEMDRATMEVAQDRMPAVATAERNLEKAVDDVRDQATMATAVGSLRIQASDLQTAVTDLAQHVQC